MTMINAYGDPADRPPGFVRAVVSGSRPGKAAGSPMSETIETLPEIRAYVLWHCNYWDGPLSGVCLVEDRVCWFQTPADPLDDEREWFIYEMTDTEVRAEVTQHFLFERYVGVHTCIHTTLDGQRPIGSTHPRAQWAQFYDHATEFDYVGDKQPIGKLIR